VTPPSNVDVSKLDLKNSVYEANKKTWETIDLLYEGGDRIRNEAARFLDRKPKELPEIYNSRLGRFRYQNCLSSGVDWYLSSIFRTAPEIDYKTQSPDGTLTDIVPPAEVKAFFTAFQNDCDRRGTTFIDFWRDVLRSMLLYQSAWVLVDLPRADVAPLTLDEQQRRGGLDAYLVCYQASEVVNWDEDDLGNLNWVMVKCESVENVFLGKPVIINRWYYYDRQNYSVYESRNGPGETAKQAELISSGRHSMAEVERVPITRVQVPKGLWMANKVLPQVLDHLNIDNVYSWALFMANMAMPVLIGAGNETPTLSEAGYIRLPTGGKIEWTEPPGASFERSQERIASLREEIYRSMYLTPQGRSSAATPAMQSGYSKELEMAPAADIQNAFGDVIRAAMEKILGYAAQVRHADVKFAVRGFTFVQDPEGIELQGAMLFAQLQVQSDTSNRENQKKAVRARFPDLNATTMQKILDEIETAPNALEQQATQQAMEQDKFAQQLKVKAEMSGNKG
jgi:hypothetical protein